MNSLTSQPGDSEPMYWSDAWWMLYSGTASVGELYAHAIREAGRMRREAFAAHRYLCDWTIKTCVVLQEWHGVKPRIPHALWDFEITDSHW